MAFLAPIPTEDQEAKALVAYMQFKGLHFHHSPNETGQTMEARRRASRMKALGTSAGYPDYTIVIPSSRYPNAKANLIFIELKRTKNSTISEPQKEWIDRLSHANVPARICKGFDEAKAFIDEIASL